MRSLSTGEKLVVGGVAVTAVVGFVWWRRSRRAPKPAPSAESDSAPSDTTKPHASGKSASAGAAEKAPTGSAASIAKDRGNTLFKGGHYEDAIAAYTEAIELSKDLSPSAGGKDFLERAKYFGNRAACNVKLKRYPAAIEDCTHALAVDPNYTKALQRRIAAHEALDHHRDALDDYTLLIRQPPMQEDQATQQHIQKLIDFLGKEALAEVRASRTPAWQPRKAIRTYLESYNRGERRYRPATLEKETKTEEDVSVDALIEQAMQDMYVATSTDPDTDERRPAEALLKFERVRTMLEESGAPARAEVYEYLGMLHYLHREPTLAEAELLQAIKLYGSSGEGDGEGAVASAAHAMCKLADVVLAQGRAGEQRERALGLLRKACALAPQDTAVHLRCGEALQQCELASESIEVFERLLAVDETDYDARVHLGLSYYQRMLSAAAQHMMDHPTAKSMPEHSSMDRDDRAMTEAFEYAMKSQPSRYEAFVTLGFILLSTMDTQRAVECFDRALEIAPECPLALTHKGMVLLQSRRVDDALVLHQRALAKDPECVEAMCNLGLQYLGMDRIDDAIATYDRAIALTDVDSNLIVICGLREAALSRKRVSAKFSSA